MEKVTRQAYCDACEKEIKKEDDHNRLSVAPTEIRKTSEMFDWEKKYYKQDLLLCNDCLQKIESKIEELNDDIWKLFKKANQNEKSI